TDGESGRDWPLAGITHNLQLPVPSAVGGIKGSYQTFDGFSASGVIAPSFRYESFAVELWVRPDLSQLGPDHQVIFETGGGQNGTSVLLTENGLRFLGSKGNKRNLDEVVPLTGLNLGDFIQIVYSYDILDQTFFVSVR